MSLSLIENKPIFINLVIQLDLFSFLGALA